jgi:4'-phosphopantetheinyl transferase
VHVWCAELDRAEHDPARLLSAEERARAARVMRAQARERWIGSRAALRTVLSRYLGVDPSAVRLTVDERGKPCLGRGEPSFNLSHSGALCLIAVWAGGQVGIDVEIVERARPLDVAGVARRAFGAQEAARLEGLPPAAARLELLRLWVRYEARLKCLGGAAEDSAEQEPSIQELALDGHAVAALATLPATASEPCLWLL